MKHVVIITLASLLISLYASGQRFILDSVAINGHQRVFWMQLPETPVENAPLIMVCHGYGSTGNNHTWMKDIAAEKGAVLCMICVESPHGMLAILFNRVGNRMT